MTENRRKAESPIELLRQLLEESGKWTEEIVIFARNQIILYTVLVLVIIQAIITAWYGFYDKGPISFPYIIVIAIALIFFVLVVSNAIIQLRRKYKNRIARRDRWREKFEILKKKEEEIERLLSEEEG